MTEVNDRAIAILEEWLAEQRTAEDDELLDGFMGSIDEDRPSWRKLFKESGDGQTG